MNTALQNPTNTVLRDNLITTIDKTGRFTHLMQALNAAGLVLALKGSGPYTLFAPDDAAFERLDLQVLADLLRPGSRPRLARVLKLHMVLGRVVTAAAGDKPFTLRAVQGGDLAVDPSNGFTVNQARVVERDIVAANGVVHVIDTVLMPAAS